MLLGYGVCQRIQGGEILRPGLALAHDRSQHFRLQVGDQAGDLLHGLGAPSVGADDGGVLQLRPEGVRQVRRRVDRRMGAEVDRGGADDDGGGIHQVDGQIADVSHGKLVLFDFHSPLHQGVKQVIHHDLRASVHGDVGDGHEIGYPVGDPVTVSVQDEFGLVVDGPVARGDHVELVALELLHVVPYDGPEGHHDLGEVALGTLVDGRTLPGEGVRGGQVGAEEVAGEQDLFLPEVSAHGLRPVDPGGMDKREGPVPQREALAVPHGVDDAFVDMEVVLEQLLGLRGADHPCLRVHVQKGGNRSRVVLLGVEGDNVVDLLHVLQLGQQNVLQFRIGGVDEGCLLRSFHKVGVVARSLGERDERVEKAAVPVYGSHEEHTVADESFLHSCHRSFQADTAASRRKEYAGPVSNIPEEIIALMQCGGKGPLCRRAFSEVLFWETVRERKDAP
ncbi:hypothetical protein SDC9_67681 [bioreactor metagenome]|uniref:Uncharacterized protein n=1 Tax=bioreactor metagenome TaxID=1076179 RepID=A0A644XZB0_9ZZZZ